MHTFYYISDTCVVAEWRFGTIEHGQIGINYRRSALFFNVIFNEESKKAKSRIGRYLYALKTMAADSTSVAKDSLHLSAAEYAK